MTSLLLGIWLTRKRDTSRENQVEMSAAAWWMGDAGDQT